MKRTLTALIEREEGGFVALCPGLDIAGQGESVEAARRNLEEALELFFETAWPEQAVRRLASEPYATRIEVAGG